MASTSCSQRKKKNRINQPTNEKSGSEHIGCIRCLSPDLLSSLFTCMHGHQAVSAHRLYRPIPFTALSSMGIVDCNISIIKYEHWTTLCSDRAQRTGWWVAERINLLIWAPLRPSTVSLFMCACNKCPVIFMTIVALTGAKRFCIWIAFEFMRTMLVWIVEMNSTQTNEPKNLAQINSNFAYKLVLQHFFLFLQQYFSDGNW